MITSSRSSARADLTSEEARIRESCNRFAIDLYRHLREGNGNLFFSPYSAFYALAITREGADGETRRQMDEALRLPPGPDRLHPFLSDLNRRLTEKPESAETELKLATAFWTARGFAFSAPFLDLATRQHDVHVEEVDFAGAAEECINRWVERQSDGKIRDLIRPGSLDPTATTLVLTNVLHLLGVWDSKFKVADTAPRTFRVDQDTRIDVPTMSQASEFRYHETDAAQILELPYEGNELAMLLVLPAEDRALEEIESALSPETLVRWTESLEACEVEVFLPKLKLESTCPLKSTLKAMGMRDVFNYGVADLSRMTGRTPAALAVSDVFQKTYLDVNEEGVEAAAATAVEFDKLCCSPEAKVFRTDRPFLFVIRESRSGVILFVGRVLRPDVTTSDHEDLA